MPPVATIPSRDSPGRPGLSNSVADCCGSRGAIWTGPRRQPGYSTD